MFLKSDLFALISCVGFFFLIFQHDGPSSHTFCGLNHLLQVFHITTRGGSSALHVLRCSSFLPWPVFSLYEWSAVREVGGS